jgi:hypothetical protein
MLNAPLRIMIVAALCVLGLIGLVVREGYERSRPSTPGSRDIEMQMQAVDPRALLSGHYVIVSLQTTFPAFTEGAPCSTFAALGDEESWVALAHIGPEHVVQPPADTPLRYVPVGVTATHEEAQAIARRINAHGPLAVRGTAFCSELTEEPGRARTVSVQTQLRGVERFYAPQAQAERIDALMRERSANDQATIFAIVNIGRDGRARLKGLNVNGEIIELNWL